ncbi:MAG: glycosyltransferase family 4 protein [bacterium]
MKILFVGQRGMPAYAEAPTGRPYRELRVQSLAQMLAKDGHDVAVTCGRPFVSKNISCFNGVELVHLFSLGPNKAEGWVHTFLELITMWWRNPDVVHVHGWKMAALARVAALLRPETTYVWTVDAVPDLPRWMVRLVAGSAKKVFDAVTVPTRALQYGLARDIKVTANYVPDGYVNSELPDIPLKHFGLRKGQQYVLALVETPAAVRKVARAYVKAGLRKKLVVLREGKGDFSRLAKKYSFLHLAGEQTGRGLATLLAQASIIVVDSDSSPDTALQAMACGKTIIAITPSPAEEVLGGAALFVGDKNKPALAEVLKSVAGSAARQAAWGRKAKKRAQAHFAWERILPDYEALYHYPRVRSVALDSAINTSFTKLPAVR